MSLNLFLGAGIGLRRADCGSGGGDPLSGAVDWLGCGGGCGGSGGGGGGADSMAGGAVSTGLLKGKTCLHWGQVTRRAPSGTLSAGSWREKPHDGHKMVSTLMAGPS